MSGFFRGLLTPGASGGRIRMSHGPYDNPMSVLYTIRYADKTKIFSYRCSSVIIGG
jgi:hypothetical protein